MTKTLDLISKQEYFFQIKVKGLLVQAIQNHFNMFVVLAYGV
jgi:hypothetical protein